MTGLNLAGQDFSVSSIDPELTEDADAVIRYHEGEFEILSISKARYKVRKAVTVLNKDGSHNGVVSVGHDKLIKITDFSVNKYDENGERTFKAKSSDFTEESSTSGGTFFDDSRVTWIDVRQDDFPYTVEYEYEISFKYLYSIPDWRFVPNIDESVEFSKYTLISPNELKPRYLSKNIDDPILSSAEGKVIMTWELKNSKGNSYEPYTESIYKNTPHVVASPGKFEFEGYQGDLSTWSGMANWQNELNKERDELSTETIEKLKVMTDGLSEREKVKKVYEYVQANTRYVSVQLGIGGFQPFPANFVDTEGYGDCKALSFYTQSLLKNLGIKAHYTWVYGGDNPPPVNEDFPDDTFNHIILCVPMEKDTVWLECTSQTKPFGYMGSFTDDRDVFVITDDGGKIVRTPKYDLEDNIQISKAEVEIDENGNAKVDVKNSYKGLKYEYRGLSYTINLGDDKHKEWLEKNIDIPSFTISNYTFTNQKESIPTAEIEAQLLVNKLSSKSGTRFFLQPNLMNRNTFIPNKDDERENSIFVDYTYQEQDSITYKLPAGHAVESFFDPVEINSEFGSYRAEIKKIDENSILYVRSFKQFEGKFPNTAYENFIDFHKKVVRADKRRISFKKKT